MQQFAGSVPGATLKQTSLPHPPPPSPPLPSPPSLPRPPSLLLPLSSVPPPPPSLPSGSPALPPSFSLSPPSLLPLPLSPPAPPPSLPLGCHPPLHRSPIWPRLLRRRSGQRLGQWFWRQRERPGAGVERGAPRSHRDGQDSGLHSLEALAGHCMVF